MHSFPSTLITLFVRPDALLQTSLTSTFKTLAFIPIFLLTPHLFQLFTRLLHARTRNSKRNGKKYRKSTCARRNSFGTSMTTRQKLDMCKDITALSPPFSISISSYSSSSQGQMSHRVPQIGNAQLSHSASSASLSPIYTPPRSKHISKTLPAVLSLPF